MVTSLFAEDAVHFVLRTVMRLGAPASDAEDLTQEVFLIVHRRVADYDASRRIEPWLFGIAKNVVRDQRRLARHRHEVPEDPKHPEPGREAVDASGDVDLLRRALAALPDELAEVIVACDLSELTVREAVDALGVPEGTVKDRLQRARLSLREHVARLRKGTFHA